MLILEIATGIVLGLAIIAIVATYWEFLVLALSALFTLGLAAAGIAILYNVCGTWKNVALVVLVLGIVSAAGLLIAFLNQHEKYGPTFHAVESSIFAGVLLSTLVGIVIWLPLSILLESWIRIPFLYIGIFPSVFTFAISFLLFYRHGLKKSRIQGAEMLLD